MDCPFGLDEKMFTMSLEGNRRNTYKDWPFLEDCVCTPERMAEAGFYHCPSDREPDLVCCYVCLKELDGWQPEDDPWEEHRSHAKQCAFVIIGKTERELTTEEVIKLDYERCRNIIKKNADHLLQRYEKVRGKCEADLADIIKNKITNKKNNY